VTVIPIDHIETIDDLINEMAAAIGPYAFSKKGSDQEQNLCRMAARRALTVCAPIIVREAAALAGDNAEIASNIMRLNDIF
jgi:hypothetical protein